MKNINRKVRLIIHMKLKDLNIPMIFYAETTWDVARAKIREVETRDVTFAFFDSVEDYNDRKKEPFDISIRKTDIDYFVIEDI